MIIPIHSILYQINDDKELRYSFHHLFNSNTFHPLSPKKTPESPIPLGDGRLLEAPFNQSPIQCEEEADPRSPTRIPAPVGLGCHVTLTPLGAAETILPQIGADRIPWRKRRRRKTAPGFRLRAIPRIPSSGKGNENPANSGNKIRQQRGSKKAECGMIISRMDGMRERRRRRKGKGDRGLRERVLTVTVTVTGADTEKLFWSRDVNWL